MPIIRYTELSKVRSSNATDTSFASKIPTTTAVAASAADGIIDPKAVAGQSPDTMVLIPYGKANDNDTFDVRVIGWSKVSTLYVPLPIVEFTATLSAITGVSGAAVDNTERFADTISGVDYGIGVTVSPGSDFKPATIEFGIGPYEFVEVQFDRVLATECNALYYLTN